jgi:hypothetical protein
MARETKAQKAARIGALLADYDNVTRQLRKLERDQEALKEQVEEIEPGVYGEWERASGQPREIWDRDAIRADYNTRNKEIPTKPTKAPIVVRHVASTGGK